MMPSRRSPRNLKPPEPASGYSAATLARAILARHHGNLFDTSKFNFAPSPQKGFSKALLHSLHHLGFLVIQMRNCENQTHWEVSRKRIGSAIGQYEETMETRSQIRSDYMGHLSTFRPPHRNGVLLTVLYGDREDSSVHHVASWLPTFTGPSGFCVQVCVSSIILAECVMICSQAELSNSFHRSRSLHPRAREPDCWKAML